MKSALIRVLFLLFAIGVYTDKPETVSVSVILGESDTLYTGVTEVRRKDEIEWRLNVNRIARISNGSIRTEGASRDRLKLNNQTGDLKITNIKTTDSGKYKLEITNSTGTTVKIFSVSVVSVSVSVLEGDSVTLHTGVPEPQRYDVIQWRFEHQNSPIAEINRKTRQSFTSNTDGRFRGRLQLDYWTVSLTIRNIRNKHSGEYEFSTTNHTIHKSFNVTVSGNSTIRQRRYGERLRRDRCLKSLSNHVNHIDRRQPVNH
ncbi:uncharacterized protein LOC143735299 [Siphateles boraxobius]|uniref:uncharacterized protein LOC143735299 n=1 Tax=Siphateles boraxobius TaxID=180520 RepID=UPI004063005C